MKKSPFRQTTLALRSPQGGVRPGRWRLCLLYTSISWVADFIIGLMPYGVVALLASTLATRGLQAILDMGLFVVLLYVGLLIMFVVQAILIASFGYNPITYFKKAKAPLLLAFTSRSSMGVLPLTVETLTKRLGVNATTANTVASFGTTAGMQGCAGVFPALVVVYISNVAVSYTHLAANVIPDVVSKADRMRARNVCVDTCCIHILLNHVVNISKTALDNAVFEVPLRTKVYRSFVAISVLQSFLLWNQIPWKYLVVFLCLQC